MISITTGSGGTFNSFKISGSEFNSGTPADVDSSAPGVMTCSGADNSGSRNSAFSISSGFSFRRL
jgi:hypothetical protein